MILTRRRRQVEALAIAMLLASSAASADDSLNIQEWAGRPGVKLLAVEFYATWCVPCMEAVPKWQALHEKYKAEGLRLVVVNTLDPAGACRTQGWNPDGYVCDLDGRIARSLGVGQELPAAFLWSWQGNLLVQRGHVDAVGAAVDTYLRQSPRVLVDAFDGREPSPTLRAMVESEVGQGGKLVVVASDADRAALRALRKDTHEASRRDDQQCKLGQEVSANSRLEARRLGNRATQTLTLSLYSVESGCQLATVYVPWNAERPEASVREAAGALLARLSHAPDVPASPIAAPLPAGQPKEALLGEKGSGDWDPSAGAAQQGVVQFSSTPRAATVLVDGRLLCKETPCSKALPLGRHTISMQLEQYLPRSEVVDVREGSIVDWTLAADFAELTVTTVPRIAAITVDGVPAPVGAIRVAPGVHRVMAEDPCHYPLGKQVVLKRGEVRTETLELETRPSAISVTATDARGNDVAADVWVDGRSLGRSPGVFKVPLCSRRVALHRDGRPIWSAALSLVEKKVADVHAALQAPALIADPSSAIRIGTTAQPSSSRRAWGVALTVAGGALGVGAIVSGALWSDINGQSVTTEADKRALEDEGQVYAILAGALGGGGALALIGGIVLLTTGSDSSTSSIQPAIGPSWIGAVGSF